MDCESVVLVPGGAGELHQMRRPTKDVHAAERRKRGLSRAAPAGRRTMDQRRRKRKWTVS